MYGQNEDVTNSTLSLPSGEDEHFISCMTEPATYPGRIVPVWSVMGRDEFPHSVSADGLRLVFTSVFTSREQEAEYKCTSGDQVATVDIAVSTPKYGIRNVLTFCVWVWYIDLEGYTVYSITHFFLPLQ